MTNTLAIAVMLAQHLSEQPVRTFDWGSNNCCHHAAAWVQRLTGRNPMHGLAATPDARAAWRLVSALGGSLQAAWTAQLGTEPVAAALAEVGDIVLFKAAAADHAAAGGTGAMLGVCCGDAAALIDEHGSLVMLPMAYALCAWKVVP
jgi:hypothetical protein